MKSTFWAIVAVILLTAGLLHSQTYPADSCTIRAGYYGSYKTAFGANALGYTSINWSAYTHIIHSFGWVYPNSPCIETVDAPILGTIGQDALTLETKDGSSAVKCHSIADGLSAMSKRIDVLYSDTTIKELYVYFKFILPSGFHNQLNGLGQEWDAKQRIFYLTDINDPNRTLPFSLELIKSATEGYTTLRVRNYINDAVANVIDLSAIQINTTSEVSTTLKMKIKFSASSSNLTVWANGNSVASYNSTLWDAPACIRYMYFGKGYKSSPSPDLWIDNLIVNKTDILAGNINGSIKSDFGVITFNEYPSILFGLGTPHKAAVDGVRAAGKKNILAIGGWAVPDQKNEEWLYLMQNRSRIDSFVTNMYNWVSLNNFDGIDFDFEYPGNLASSIGDTSLTYNGRTSHLSKAKQKSEYTYLITKTRAYFNANGKSAWTVSVTTPPFYMGNRAVNNYDYQTLYNTCNWILPMTYDFSGGWSDTVSYQSAIRPSGSTYPSHKQRMSFARTTFYIDSLAGAWGVPVKTMRKKFLMGAPFYGQCFYNNTNLWQANTSTGGGGLAFDYYKVRDLLSKGWTVARDTFYKQSTLKNNTSNSFSIQLDNLVTAPANTGIIVFDDTLDFEDKIRYIDNNNYLGLAVWDITGDVMKVGSVYDTPMTDKLWNLINHNPTPPPITSRKKRIMYKISGYYR